MTPCSSSLTRALISFTRSNPAFCTICAGGFAESVSAHPPKSEVPKKLTRNFGGFCRPPKDPKCFPRKGGRRNGVTNALLVFSKVNYRRTFQLVVVRAELENRGSKFAWELYFEHERRWNRFEEDAKHSRHDFQTASVPHILGL